jgi:hypothetical protein
MSLRDRGVAVFLAGAAILIVGAATHLGTIVQVSGGIVMVIGAARLAWVRFSGRLGLPGGADISASVEPGGDVGFDVEAESRENEGSVAPQEERGTRPQAPRTIPAGSSGEDSSPGPE